MKSWLIAIAATIALAYGAQAQSYGSVTATLSSSITNPSSTLTLTSATTAYASGNLIANNAVAGSVAVPSFNIANPAGGAAISRVRLASNDPTSGAWNGQTIAVDIWAFAPAFVNGDRGAWSISTGSGGHLATYSCVMSALAGDGVYAECAPAIGTAALVKLGSGTTIFWTAQAVTGSGTTAASKTLTLTPEVQN